jgi:hypothetical protein
MIAELNLSGQPHQLGSLNIIIKINSRFFQRIARATTPVNAGTTGKYAVCTDQSGQIWYSENGSAAECLETRKPIEQSIGDITGSPISGLRVPNEDKRLVNVTSTKRG